MKNFKTKIMGIINANEDSFFKNSRFYGSNAVLKIEHMISDGADIIDLGGVSSRPGSIAVSWEEELNRVKPIIDLIYDEKLYEKVKFSLDSYQPKVLDYALNRGFSIVNDITGLENDEVCKIASKYNAQVVIMHMQNNPENMQKSPEYDDVIKEIDTFFNQRIKKAKNFGINNIVLDVGIGFGKNLQHNLLLLKKLEHFKHFGYELLIGASRKSMINLVIESTIEERLPGTLAIHLESIKNGASIIRCHDVKEHYQAIKIQEAINNVEIL
ncbi:dihydropteroate synthase [Arcobacter sp.]|uniref:dihydropteroate synthase n=3 Tax=Arcobacter sp. TaxID=1872629 RepID=UPI003D0F3DA8